MNNKRKMKKNNKCDQNVKKKKKKKEPAVPRKIGYCSSKWSLYWAVQITGAQTMNRESEWQL
jgi:hypothetical protein